MKKLLLMFALAGTLAFSPLCLAQTTVALSPLALPQFLNNNGQPCSGCKLSTFSAGTTSNLVTYSESTGTTPNTNPIIMDSSGRPSNGSANVEIFLTSASYKFKMTDANNVQLWVVDNITWATPLSTFSGITSTGNSIIKPAVAATGGANQSSPTLCLDAFYFNITSLTDAWCLFDSIGTGTSPTSTFTLTHSGSGGTTAVNFPNLTFSTLAVTGNETVGGTLGVTGTMTAGSVNTGPDVDATTFGGTDICAKIIAAMNSSTCSTTGCNIRIPAGTYICTTQLLIPNDAATMPLQKSFRLIGAGAGTNSAAGAASLAPNGGTIMDMQFSATTGKIDTRGAGYLEITGISFKDTASDCTPFLFDTNTVLHLHDVAFYGSASGASACNDGIILGGTTHTFCGTAVCAFQGYGTVIRDNLFHRIRKAIKFDTDANNVQVVNNTVWVDSGNTTGGAIEIAPTASTSVGNYFAGNLIEATNYKYGFWLKTNSFTNSFIANGCWDSTVTTTACIHTDSGATNNIVIEGFADDTKPGLEDANTVRNNTIISSHARTAGAGLGSFLNEPFTIVDSSAGPGAQIRTAGPSISEYGLIRTDTNDQMSQELQCLTLHSWGLLWSPLGGTAENVLCIEYLGAQQYTVALPGTTFNSFDAPNGDLKIRSKSGNTLFLGDVSTTAMQILNGAVSSYNAVATTGNGIASEVATVDLTAQTAAITTTTLNPVTLPAGQYMLTWNAKVTTAGTTSTLGPMTIGWTDPDSVALSSVMSATSAAGSITVTGVTTNTTSTFLIGTPLMLNIKASTNVTYAFAYASTGTAMQYNLHIKLTRM